MKRTRAATPLSLMRPRFTHLFLVALGAAIGLMGATLTRGSAAAAAVPGAQLLVSIAPPPPLSSPAPSRAPVTRRPLATRTLASPRPSPSSQPAAVDDDGTPRPFYLVCSPESNGNRFMVKLIAAAGCYGVSGHYQPLDLRQRAPSSTARERKGTTAVLAPSPNRWPDHIRPPSMWPAAALRAPCLVMHRSMPHNRVWVNISSLVDEIETAGYEPRLVVMLRREDIAADSQVHAKHVRTLDEAQANIWRAQRALITAIAELPRLWFRLVLYHQLGDDSYVRSLFSRDHLALTLPRTYPRFEDRDSKHIEHSETDDRL